MDLVVEIVVRVLLAGYVGMGVWMTMRVLALAGLRWWWALILWAPAACWLVPGAALAGLLATPVPIILTWAFAYAEWPALIDRARIGRRAPVSPDGESLSARARAHTFFAGMDMDMDGDETPAAAHQRTAPQPRRASGGDQVVLTAEPGQPPARPEPMSVRQSQPTRTPPCAPADEPPGSTPRENWMLSGFDNRGRALRYQLRADDIRACDDGFIVGRNPEVAHLVISDGSVSRNHARLRLKGTRLLIEDLDSANGTWIDDRALSPHRAVEVDNGALIEFGAVKLTLTHA
jgi:hypothetical protein